MHDVVKLYTIRKMFTQKLTSRILYILDNWRCKKPDSVTAVFVIKLPTGSYKILKLNV